MISCSRCGNGHWKPTRAMQPILEVRCSCGHVEWLGFLPAEWGRYVAPLVD